MGSSAVIAMGTASVIQNTAISNTTAPMRCAWSERLSGAGASSAIRKSSGPNHKPILRD